MHGNIYNLLISCISYEVRYKEYHHQKLALESRKVCHTPAYLATLVHSNNTKNVKELMAYIRKKSLWPIYEFHHCIAGECIDGTDNDTKKVPRYCPICLFLCPTPEYATVSLSSPIMDLKAVPYFRAAENNLLMLRIASVVEVQANFFLLVRRK